MKNVVLSEENKKKLDVIREVSDGNMGTGLAASLLDLSRRQIYRLVAKYKQNGKAAFVHGNTGRKPKIAISDETKKAVVGIYESKYSGIDFADAYRLMEKNNNITISYQKFSEILHEFGIIPPRSRNDNGEGNNQIIFTEEKKDAIAELYKSKYYDVDFVQACRLMEKNDNLSVSVATFRNIMREKKIYSPRSKRRKEGIKNTLENVVGKCSVSRIGEVNCVDNKNCLVFVVPCPAGFVPEG